METKIYDPVIYGQRVHLFLRSFLQSLLFTFKLELQLKQNMDPVKEALNIAFRSINSTDGEEFKRFTYYSQIILKLLSTLRLVPECEFIIETSFIGQDGSTLRPDLVITWPSESLVLVIDWKTGVQSKRSERTDEMQMRNLIQLANYMEIPSIRNYIERYGVIVNLDEDEVRENLIELYHPHEIIREYSVLRDKIRKSVEMQDVVDQFASKLQVSQPSPKIEDKPGSILLPPISRSVASPRKRSSIVKLRSP